MRRRWIAALIGLTMSTAAAAQDAPRKGPPRPAPPEHVVEGPTLVPKQILSIPSASVAVTDPANTLALDLSTGGRVLILMRPDKAPKHVERIKALTRQHFYDGLIFHRVIEGFMAQGGDPTGTGQGGSKLPNLKPEFNDLPHVRGAAAMARADAEDSANSQFYIMLGPKLSLDNHYTVWGRVISGMSYVDALEKGEPPANPSKILQASILADKVPPKLPAPAAAAPAPAPAPAAGMASTGPATSTTVTTTMTKAVPPPPPGKPAPARR